MNESTGRVKDIKPSGRSIWIERPGKPDLYGAVDNAVSSVKDANGFTLELGDAVQFEEGFDAGGRPTAKNITLSQKRSGMSGNQNNNQNKQNQKQQGAPRVYVDFPKDGQVITESSKGKYTIKVQVGQAVQSPSMDILTRVILINGETRQQVKSVEVYMPMEVIIENLKLDLSQSVFVEVEKTGYGASADGKDRIQIPTGSVKKGTVTNLPLKRLTSQFVSFAQGNSPNYIRIFKKDADGYPAGGPIQVVINQRGKVNGTAVTNGMIDLQVNASGIETLAINLDERHAVISVTDLDSGQVSNEYLKKS